MLVLSRKLGESIELPAVGVTVRVIGLKKSRIQLGIEAPQSIQITRGEKADVDSTWACPEAETWSEIESSIMALADLSDSRHTSLARQLASEVIGRLAQGKAPADGPLRQSNQPSAMAERLTIRREVLEELRRKQSTLPTRTGSAASEPAAEDPQADRVRQATAGYAVDGSLPTVSC